MAAYRFPTDVEILPPKQVSGPLSIQNIPVFSGTCNAQIISLNIALFFRLALCLYKHSLSQLLSHIFVLRLFTFYRGLLLYPNMLKTETSPFDVSRKQRYGTMVVTTDCVNSTGVCHISLTQHTNNQTSKLYKTLDKF